MEPTVLCETRGETLVITINRPDRRNAVNAAVADGIAASLTRLDGTPGLKVGVLTGAGKGFCAGMDLRAFTAGERSDGGGRGFVGIVERPPAKPLIAAIEGFALAGGLEVALACDLIVASRDALLGLPEVKRGLTASGGGLIRLPRRIPFQVAAEAALTGVPLTAERGEQVGLVNRLVDPGEALAAALELAAEIAVNAPLAVSATKRILNEADEWSAVEMWRRQQEISGPVDDSEDAREGSRAFVERREPRWRGS